jgi:hypothetical protein
MKGRKRMKKLTLLVVVLSLAACAPITPPTPTCTITWSCQNTSCAYEEGSWNGTSTFTGADDESDCVAWGTAFRYSGGYTSNCSCSN